MPGGIDFINDVGERLKERMILLELLARRKNGGPIFLVFRGYNFHKVLKVKVETFFFNYTRMTGKKTMVL
jgi:hypothetical protein